MSQADKARSFAALHQKGDPLVLYNIWDAGSAKAVAAQGAPALATGSWSVAAAQGYGDAQEIPLEFLLQIVTRICATVEVPVSVDFEGGYAVDPDALAENARQLIQTGAIGINFEDRIVQGTGLHSVADQAARIAAIKSVATDEDMPLFVNARTDLFLGSDPATHRDHLNEALDRAAAYAEAGADGFFIPGLTDTDLIAQIAEAVTLPVNVMMMPPLKQVAELAQLGAARISYGPGAYRKSMKDLQAAYAGIK